MNKNNIYQCCKMDTIKKIHDRFKDKHTDNVSFNYDNASEFTQCKMISNELFENYCPERLK